MWGQMFVPSPYSCKTCWVWGSWNSPWAGAGTGLPRDTSQPLSFLPLARGKIKLDYHRELSPAAGRNLTQVTAPEAEQDTQRPKLPQPGEDRVARPWELPKLSRTGRSTCLLLLLVALLVLLGPCQA